MEKSNSSTDFVNVLTTTSPRAASGDFKIVGVKLDIRGGDLGKNNNGGGRSVDPAMFFSDWDSLNPMSAGFPLELIKGANPGNFDDVGINLSGFPADFGSIAAIHAHQIIHPEGRFFTAGSGTEFENGNIRINGGHTN